MLNKDLSNIENSKDVTNNSFIRKNVSILQERAEESDAIFGDKVKQTSKLEIFKQKKGFCNVLRAAVSKIKILKYFDKLDVVMF